MSEACVKTQMTDVFCVVMLSVVTIQMTIKRLMLTANVCLCSTLLLRVLLCGVEEYLLLLIH